MNPLNLYILTYYVDRIEYAFRSGDNRYFDKPVEGFSVQ